MEAFRGEGLSRLPHDQICACPIHWIVVVKATG